MNFEKLFRVVAGKKINLNKVSPKKIDCGFNDFKERLEANKEILRDLQYKLYAENKQSLIIVLQALDAAGKDGVINHVIAAMNPQGCRSQSFKVPSTNEKAHDFLWRIHITTPKTGEVVVFNRSHYEEVLAPRVHGDLSGSELKNKFEVINDFEKMLAYNNTKVIKFFLHISKEEQLERFAARLDEEDKHWKISENDYKEREFWDDYMEAFSDSISNSSTKEAPWYIIPANSKKFRNFVVSEILVHTLKEMNPQLPEPRINVEEIRKLYHQNLVKQAKESLDVSKNDEKKLIDFIKNSKENSENVVALSDIEKIISE